MLLRTEGKSTEENSSINFAEVLIVLHSVPGFGDKYPLLSGIDPYSDTVFEFGQLEGLAKELVNLHGERGGGFILEATAFIRKAESGDNVVFIGD